MLYAALALIALGLVLGLVAVPVLFALVIVGGLMLVLALRARRAGAPPSEY